MSYTLCKICWVFIFEFSNLKNLVFADGRDPSPFYRVRCEEMPRTGQAAGPGAAFPGNRNTLVYLNFLSV